MSQSIDIATGRTASSKIWKNQTVKWADFVQKLAGPVKTNETLKEFLASTKQEQTNIKDVGGYVGAYLRGGKRNKDTVVHRQLATLDIDFAHLDFWDDFTLQFDNAAVIHSTHKHHDSSPRYRLLMPLSRECSPDEYSAVTRKIAGDIGIELFDATTFETNRLMFYPSVPRDQEYYFEEQQGSWIDVDKILDSYADWKDTSLWPTSDKQIRELGEAAKKQEDPTEKKGIVGAFCRTYNIHDAIGTFLTDEYLPTTDDTRYTYTKGSTAAGLIIYDDLLAYSHHGTDPCSGKLSNAFDLVRLHKFGHLDSDRQTTGTPKSYIAMDEFSREDAEVKKTLTAEMFDSMTYDFAEDEESIDGDQDDLEWAESLERDSKGKPLSSANNISLILAGDARFKGNFKRNDFDGKRYVSKTLPWRKVASPEPIKDVDYSGVRQYLDIAYGVTGSQKIDDGLAVEFEKQSFHPIKDFLRGLKWDGVKRIDTLLIDYFGADDNLYTREAMRKTLIAAVARVLNAGCKYDTVLTLVGPQGTKKSSFFKKLGKDWFSDTFSTVHGSEAFEQIQGKWIIEMAELAGLRKAEAEAVKQYISKQEDYYRPPYTRTPENFKRQCVFVATTNIDDFLNDVTGSRRFWPIKLHPERVTKDVWQDLEQDVPQIWAEAMAGYKAGEALFLSKEAEAIAGAVQRKHSVTDDRKGIIEQYLSKDLDAKFYEGDVFERRIALELQEMQGEPRQHVCIAEIWCECLGKAKEDMDRYKTREINDIMKSLEGWSYVASTKNFGIYGKQKYFSRNIQQG